MLDIRGSRELQATVLSLRAAQRTIRTGINKNVRAKINPLWRGELAQRAHTPLEQLVVASGARATASDRGVTLYAATSRRPLSGGLVPSDNPWGVELGAHRRRVEVSQRSRSGRTYRRPLTVGAQFKPRQRDGMVAMDAASETGTRVVALWVHTVVDELAAIPGVEISPA